MKPKEVIKKVGHQTKKSQKAKKIKSSLMKAIKAEVARAIG
jgi:hypothetical protein